MTNDWDDSLTVETGLFFCEVICKCNYKYKYWYKYETNTDTNTREIQNKIFYRTVKLIRYVDSRDYFVMACEFIYMIFVAYYIVEEVEVTNDMVIL